MSGGVILSVKLKKEKGDVIQIRLLAEKNQQKRKLSQPGPKDNLGSIYKGKQYYSHYGAIINLATKVYGKLLKFIGNTPSRIKCKKHTFFLTLIGGKDLIPYLYNWNRYIWRDEASHNLFWKYHKLHQRVFKSSEFEIEIKGDSPP